MTQEEIYDTAIWQGWTVDQIIIFAKEALEGWAWISKTGEEYEIAQGNCAHGGNKYASIWMHNGMVTVDGQKISKSTGSMLTVRDALKLYPAETDRLVLLNAQYRQSAAWSENAVSQATMRLNRLYNVFGEKTDAVAVSAIVSLG